MRLTLYALILAMVQGYALSGYAQATKLNLNMENSTVREILLEIEDMSEFRFLYNSKMVDVDRTVSVEFNDLTIDKALDRLFSGTDAAYRIIDRQVVLFSKDEPVHETVDLQQQQTVSGMVTDNRGQPLPGVTVVVKGTTQGTVTSTDGNYSLSNIPDDATLVFSFVGMRTQEVVVGSQAEIDVKMEVDLIGLEEVVAIGYGTIKKSDLTGSVANLRADNFKTHSMVQFSDMLTGTVAGFYSMQGTSAAGDASLEIRGPTSLSASTDPLVVLDGVIYGGSLRDINPNDIQSIDILKDASSAAVFGAKAASGVIIITTTKGKPGKPTINFSSKIGMSESYNERRGLGPEEYIQFRQDNFRQIYPNVNYDYYTNPNNLPNTMSLEQWRNLNVGGSMDDNTREWLARLQFNSQEVENYIAGKTMDMYDEVFQEGLRQDYNLSIAGGSDNSSYYWSIAYIDNEGIRVGDEFASIRSRLNVDFKINEWLNVGVNTQFSDRDESSIPASLNFYVNSPYGQMFDKDGNLERMPHGHSNNPLLAYYRESLLNKTNSLFSNIFSNVKLPFGFNFKLSFQPNYITTKYLQFTTISKQLGGLDNEIPTGERRESSTMNWMVDNILTWKKLIDSHSFDITLLANIEENQYWSTTMSNRNFQPNQALIYHGLQFGDSPTINNNDTRSTGDALMARLNYIFMEKYLLTASIRRDGFSAFGLKNPRANFPALALGWIITNEDFFNIDIINRLKLRLSWGVNGNRDIGIYSALANTASSLWYDGTSTRVGVTTSTLANRELKWERTEALNVGFDIGLIDNRIDITADFYEMKTTNLLMNRILPSITGFSSIMANLGELENKGFDLTLNTININKPNILWNSSLVFSINRNKIKKLFGDTNTYTLLGEEITGEVPDFSNQWFPGQAIDVIWNYDVIGIWQLDEAEIAAGYNLEPGDYKSVDYINDGSYVEMDDKQFIGHKAPRFRLGLRNDFNFLKNFTASFFIRADLGHLGEYSPALQPSWESNKAWNRNVGPVPYWTVDKPHDEYPRLNPSYAGYGGGLTIYKPISFLRIQDVSIAYNVPFDVSQRLKLDNLQVFASARNLVTFTKWPGWDPESSMSPMPRTFTLGIDFSL